MWLLFLKNHLSCQAHCPGSGLVTDVPGGSCPAKPSALRAQNTAEKSFLLKLAASLGLPFSRCTGLPFSLKTFAVSTLKTSKIKFYFVLISKVDRNDEIPHLVALTTENVHNHFIETVLFL